MSGVGKYLVNLMHYELLFSYRFGQMEKIDIDMTMPPGYEYNLDDISKVSPFICSMPFADYSIGFMLLLDCLCSVAKLSVASFH